MKKIAELLSFVEEYKLLGLDPIEVMLKSLHKAQELFDCVPLFIHSDLAVAVGVSVAELKSTIAFYSYFTVDDDTVDAVNVCVGPACRMKGSDAIAAGLQQKLANDDSCVVTEVFCSGRCHQAPAVEVNQKTVLAESLDDVIALLA